MIAIIGMGSISPLGSERKEIYQAYLSTQAHYIREKKEKKAGYLNEKSESEIKHLLTEQKYYDQIDRSVQMAIFASRKALAGLNPSVFESCGVNIGSSRGPTGLFENFYQKFINKKKLPTLTSPLTTLGNVSSWVLQDLKKEGLSLSHSVTCSTALHSILNAIAWLKSGLCRVVLAGGAEAPLTPFTFAQMEALKIYSRRGEEGYPCLAGFLQKNENTMILGEGAATFVLASDTSSKPLCFIKSYGYSSEVINNPVSVSQSAKGLQQAMRKALKSGEMPDVIVTHTPGTKQGDWAEYKAIKACFGDDLPAITNNKWKVGHTLGASGALSLEMAILMLQAQRFFPLPYLTYEKFPRKIKNIMINGMGFGGNAVSLVIGQ